MNAPIHHERWARLRQIFSSPALTGGHWTPQLSPTTAAGTLVDDANLREREATLAVLTSKSWNVVW